MMLLFLFLCSNWCFLMLLLPIGLGNLDMTAVAYVQGIGYSWQLLLPGDIFLLRLRLPIFKAYLV